MKKSKPIKLEPLEFNLTPDQAVDLLAEVHDLFAEQQSEEKGLPMVFCPELLERWRIYKPILHLDPDGTISNPVDKEPPVDEESSTHPRPVSDIDAEQWARERYTLKKRTKPAKLAPKYAQKIGKPIQEFLFFKLLDKPGTQHISTVKVARTDTGSTVSSIFNTKNKDIRSRLQNFWILLGYRQSDSTLNPADERTISAQDNLTDLATEHLPAGQMPELSELLDPALDDRPDAARQKADELSDGEKEVATLIADEPAQPEAEQKTDAEPKPIKRGRKTLSIEEQHAIADYYIKNQAILNLTDVGNQYNISDRTVRRYVKNYRKKLNDDKL